MDLLTLQNVFGYNATQNSTTITIYKSDLASVGLTSTTNNTAESLLVAILLKALENFQGILSDENNQPITDENNQLITFDNSEAFEWLKLVAWKPFLTKRNNTPYITNQIIVFSYVTYQ